MTFKILVVCKILVYSACGKIYILNRAEAGVAAAAPVLVVTILKEMASLWNR